MRAAGARCRIQGRKTMKSVKEAVKKAIRRRLHNKRQICPNCGANTFGYEWRDKMSENENRISGLCQSCQDIFFEDWAKI